MNRHTRYQGAIVRDGHILVIAHRVRASGELYWLLPGGGIEPGETEEECVAREMLEETNLVVGVERLLVEMPDPVPAGGYKWVRTYLCTPLSGEARPGSEPEPEVAAAYSIDAVKWLSLADETEWGAARDDPYTYPQLRAIRVALGHA